VEVTLLVPYDKPEVVPLLYRRAEVLSTEDRDDGTLVRARVGEAELSVVEPFLVRPARRGVRSS
jgi:GTP-binding protein HflX